MEAIKVDREKDSFEDIDRILKIAEDYYREYEKSRLFHWFYLGAALLAIIFLFISLLPPFPQTNEESLKPLIVSSLILFVVASFGYVLASGQMKRKRLIISQAVEIVREAYPIIARTQDWSRLREFELRLRLSQLGVTETTIADLFAERV